MLEDFKRKSDRIKVEFKLIRQNSEWKEYNEAVTADDVTEDTPDYLVTKDGKKIYKCWVEYIKPSWDLANYVELRAVNLVNIDYGTLAKRQLTYYLKGCSFFPVQLGRDSYGYECIVNIDELTGDKGLDPQIINIIHTKILGR